MTYQTLQTNFEKELLFNLIFNMKKKRITKERGQKVAKEFLKILKAEKDAQGFMDSMTKISPYYPEIRETFLKVAYEYENEKISENLTKVREILKGGLN